MSKIKRATVILLSFLASMAAAQTREMTVTAYYFGGPETVDSVAAEKLTHIIFSFCHLNGRTLQVDDSKDAETITNLVGLKKRNPNLKVLLSLGGWGGCETCSDIFSTAKGRTEFAHSVLALNKFFGSDGIDLDWEYPGIEGYPGHKFSSEDVRNFTELIQVLRTTLGDQYEISFAAGGFQKFLEKSVDWKAVMPNVDRVNLMTYDLVNGYATITGHHTGLYSTDKQRESTDNAVNYLVKLGIPANKLVIGAAFYGRMWEDVPPENNGLYQAGKFKRGVNYKDLIRMLSGESGFKTHWDETAKAPYAYNPVERLFITFDDKQSMALKTRYVTDHRLNGIMFWEITSDKWEDGLLDTIYKTKLKYKPK